MSKAIFHAHSDSSSDSLVDLRKIITKLKLLNIDRLFLTDHNLIRQDISHYPQIIACEEITTKEGEIIGIFLRKEIPALHPLAWTLDEIKKQGGLSVAPHPFDRLRSKVINLDNLIKYINGIDIIEVYNSRTVFPNDNQKAREFAEKNDKPTIWGSDAHTLFEYGLSRFENVDCSDPDKFIASLAGATSKNKKAPLWVHGVTKYVKWKKRNSL